MRLITVSMVLIAATALGQRAGMNSGGHQGTSPGPSAPSGAHMPVAPPAHPGPAPHFSPPAHFPQSAPFSPGHFTQPSRGGLAGRTVIVPVPLFYGAPYYGYGYGSGYGYNTTPVPPEPPSPYGYAYDSGYASDPGYTAPSYAAGQAVIVNPDYQPETAHPVLRDYSNTLLPEPTLKKYENSTGLSAPDSMNGQVVANDDQPTIYLIAMKDHTIFPTVAYWVEGDTLHYVMVGGTVSRVTLDLVDRDFSKQLNDERRVEFKLPPATSTK